MNNKVFNTLSRIEEIDLEMQKGNYDNKEEFYILNEQLLSEFKVFQKKILSNCKVNYDEDVIYEAFRVMYALKKSGIPV